MAGKFGRALEVMGWRVPDQDPDFLDEDLNAPQEQVEVELRAIPGGAAEVHAPIQAVAAAEEVPATSLKRIVTIHPSTYADAALVGDAFREGVPVILNLMDVPENEARRVLDFAFGLTYGLRGSIEKVAGRVFLLSPKDVEVATQSPTAAYGAQSSSFFG